MGCGEHIDGADHPLPPLSTAVVFTSQSYTLVSTEVFFFCLFLF